MKRTISRAAAVLAAACLSTAALSACDIDSSSTGDLSSNPSSSHMKKGDHDKDMDQDKDKDQDKDQNKVRGCSATEDNKETPIGDHDFGAVSISAVYFQPGAMAEGSPMLSYDKSAAHLEVDTHMTGKNGADGYDPYGYAKDETPADMNITYDIMDSTGKSVLTGKLMEMNAGDGSHYGTNLPAGVMKDGMYKIKFTVSHPTTYALHKDLITGVPATGWYEDGSVVFDWNYKTPVKAANPVRDCDVPAYQPMAKVTPSTDPNKKPKLLPESDWKDKGKCEEPEINVGSADAAPFSIDVNYFQPGGMLNEWLGMKSMMPSYQDSIAHLEADIHMVDSASDLPVGAQGTDYGYSNGETPADLNVDYTITTKDGKKVDEGKFMEMNADDGSHYGTNLKSSIGLVPNTDYVLTLKVSHPTKYSLHIDDKTGVAVRHWYKDFTVTMPWHYTGNQTVCKSANWKDAFPPMPAKK